MVQINMFEYLTVFNVPTTKWGGGHIVLHITLCSLFLTPQLLLQYLMQGFEACITVQTCTEHVHKGNIPR